MGANFSEIAEAKENGGVDLIIDQHDNIKKKEMAQLLEALRTELPLLQSLTVSSCKVTKFPDNIGQLLSHLKSLRTVRFEDNLIPTLPDSIGDFTNLRELSLSGNKLAGYPTILNKLPKLKVLDLSSNNLSSLESFRCDSVETLKLRKNNFEEFSPLASSLPKLKILDLSENKLVALPRDIGAMTTLEQLLLRGNKLTNLSLFLASLELPLLEVLDVSENELVSIASLNQLKTLTRVELQHNKLTVLPAECFLDLSALQTLKLNDNKLTSVPPSIGSCPSLAELSLQENQLQSLPREIGNAKSLRKLYLEYNKLSSLPDEMANLKKIVVLILHHNELTVIPTCLRMMKSLLRLSLDDNPFDEAVLQTIRRDGALSLVTKGNIERSSTDGHSTLGGRERHQTLNPNNRKQLLRANSSTYRGLISSDSGAHPASHTINLHSTAPLAPREQPIIVAQHGPNPLTRGRSITSIDPPVDIGSVKVSITPPLERKSTNSKIARQSSKEKEKEEKEKESAEAIPSYSKFKTTFDSFVEESDFSKEKKETLTKLSSDKKWNLLKEYKSSTLDMLKSGDKKGATWNFTIGGGTLRKKKEMSSPQDFVNTLRGIRVTKKDLNSIYSFLNENKDLWTANFIECGGISAFIDFIATHTVKPEQNTADYILIAESLKCIKLLLEAGLKSVLTTSNAINVIALNYNSPNTDVKELTIDVLESVCAVPHVGQGIVMEALNYQHDRTKQQVHMFVPLINTLEKAYYQSMQNRTSEMTLSCLSLILGLINNVDDLEARFDLRVIMINLGILEVFEKLKRTASGLVIYQLDIFEEAMLHDEEDMVSRYGRREVWDRILAASAHSAEKGDFIRVASLTEGSMHIMRTAQVAYTDETLVKDIVEAVKNAIGKRNSDDDEYSQYWLYVIQPKQRGLLLDLSMKMSDYNFRGEIFAELRYRPWSVPVRMLISDLAENKDLGHSGILEKKVTLELDPNLDCIEVLKNICKEFGVLDDDYNLVLFRKKRGQTEFEEILLDDLRKFFEYKQLLYPPPQENFSKIFLTLKRRPLPYKISFGNEFKILYFEPRTTISQLKRTVFDEFFNNNAKNEDYGITGETSQGTIWLNEDDRLENCGLIEPCVKIALKPRAFCVQFEVDGPAAASRCERVVLDYTVPIKEVTQVLRAKIGQSAGDYSLYHQLQPDAAEVLLDPKLSLRDFMSNIGAAGTSDEKLILRRGASVEPVVNDVNIWEDKENISFENEEKSQISYATFNKLVEFLTSSEDLNRECLMVFLLTYKNFATPDLLLTKLEQRYQTPSTVNAKEANKIKMRICLFLKSWMESVYEDHSPELKEKIFQFIEGPIKQDFSSLAEGLAKSVQQPRKISNAVPSESAGTSESSSTQPKAKEVFLPKSMTDKLSILDIDPVELARQLTLSLFDIYKKIEHFEFFGQAWAKSGAEMRAPHILKMINFFNGVTTFTETVILSEKKVRNRAKLMDMFIKMAQAARELNNFHLVIAVVSSFSNSSLLRLKWTLEKLPKRSRQILAELEELMSMKNSFKTYREALKEANPPCIPYIGVYLTDLIFIEDGNPNSIGNRINFSKQLYVYNIVATIQKFQKFPYNLQPVPSIQNFFYNMPRLEEEALYRLSLQVEPRGAQRQDIL
eukprot:TRINITY_DN1942_c0_g1_i1.p1 TRINITY_DN1942_c0_g1~~TRINITY_DN1942_c0_g1_i1.p1  ORF type:complete len:1639 (+),score=512.30 TRINITY_DN1942_c0_g1_i1:223-5139(+)